MSAPAQPDTSIKAQRKLLKALAGEAVWPPPIWLMRQAGRYLPEYRATRARLGLTHYTEAEMLAVLDRAGFDAVRHRPNLGHNQARIAFLAVPRGA